jgi:hypothetical protein
MRVCELTCSLSTEDPREWTIDQVYQWVTDVVKLDEEDVRILRVNEVDGAVLLALTKDKLTSPLYNMPAGAATKLSMAIEKLKSVVG